MQQIAYNSDLNSYTTPGLYGASTAIAQTLSNCPVQNAFIMEVRPANESGSTVYQRLVRTAVLTARYERVGVNTEWTYTGLPDNVLTYSTKGTESNVTRVITLPNNYRGLLVCIRNSGGGGLLFVSVNNSGVVNVAEAIAISGITITTDTRTINVTPSTTTNISTIDIYGSSSMV